MKPFSERIGVRPSKTIIQKKSMDKDLKTALKNELFTSYWEPLINKERFLDLEIEVRNLIVSIWRDFWKENIDELPHKSKFFYSHVRDFYEKADWARMYDFLEFVPNNYKPEFVIIDEDLNKNFYKHCNAILEKELSAYRFVNGLLSPIVSEEELKSIDESLQVSDKFKPVAIHLESALKYFSDRQAPDFRNSIKESISAVESYCSILTGEATLGKALKNVKQHQEIHPALEGAFNKLYGYTNDSDGIRHALLEEDKLDQEDAKFMLVTCSAFINYLKQKSIK